MEEILPYIILILILIFFELIQIACSQSKIGKWIIPILFFLFSIFVMINLLAFEIACYYGTADNIFDMVSIETLMFFPVLNIPTAIFIITNIIIKKLTKKKSNELQN